jgi:hypothetical protein
MKNVYVIMRRTNWVNIETGRPSRPDSFIGYCTNSLDSARMVRERNEKASHCHYFSKKVKHL